MKGTTILSLLCAISVTTALTLPQTAHAQETRIFNTAKQKLAAGGRVVGGTVATADPDFSNFPDLRTSALPRKQPLV